MSTDPGWYPDEDDAALARYWDGSGWTDRTKPRAEVTATLLDRRVSLKAVLGGLAALLGVAAVVIAAALLFTRDDDASVATAAASTSTSADASASTTGVAGEPMTVERLLNVELPDLTADGGFSGGQLVDGTATVGDTGERLVATAGDTYLGDLTGDGLDDGLVFVADEFEGANSVPPRDLYLYDSSGSFLDAVHMLNLGGQAEFPAVEGGTLTFEVLSLGPGDPRCCPTVHTTVHLRWNGAEFEPA